jgi:hypothetical protein
MMRCLDVEEQRKPENPERSRKPEKPEPTETAKFDKHCCGPG